MFDNYLKGKDVSEFTNVLFKVNIDEKLYSQWSEKAWECHNMYLEENALKQWESFYKKACREIQMTTKQQSLKIVFHSLSVLGIIATILLFL